MSRDTVEDLTDHLSGGFHNPCQTHDDASHVKKSIQIARSHHPFIIFDWERYRDTTGFCPGDDAVSQSIEVTGSWEPHVTALVQWILEQDDAELFIDVGAHVGWYTRLALELGVPTLAVEASNAYMELLKANAALPNTRALLHCARGWIDEDSHAFYKPVNAKLIKVDIEGNEWDLYRILQKSFEARSIEYAVFEISPVFNDSYGFLVPEIMSNGYRCFRIDQAGKHEEWKRETLVEQLNQFPQCDVVFVAPNSKPIPIAT